MIPFIYKLTFSIIITGFLFGYDTGVVSGAMLILDAKFNLDSSWHSSIVSITMAFAALFSLYSGYFNRVKGRKMSIIFSCLTFILGNFLVAVAWNRYFLLLGRAVLGIAIGVGSMTAPVYIGVLVVLNLGYQIISY